MIAIAAAANEVKLLRRPGYSSSFIDFDALSGFRILISVIDYEFAEINKICQQYMKFESVIENLIPQIESNNQFLNEWDVSSFLFLSLIFLDCSFKWS